MRVGELKKGVAGADDREKLWHDLYKVVAALKDTMDDMCDQDDCSFDGVLAGIAEIKNLDVHIRKFDARPID